MIIITIRCRAILRPDLLFKGNMDSELTVSQKLFADFILQGKDQKTAWKLTHPKCSERSCEVKGSQLRKVKKIDDYINAKLQKREERTEVTAEKVLNRLWEIQKENADDRVHALKAIQKQQGYEKPVEHKIDATLTVEIINKIPTLKKPK